MKESEGVTIKNNNEIDLPKDNKFRSKFISISIFFSFHKRS